jgi:hypothetical protein
MRLRAAEEARQELQQQLAAAGDLAAQVRHLSSKATDKWKLFKGGGSVWSDFRRSWDGILPGVAVLAKMSPACAQYH